MAKDYSYRHLIVWQRAQSLALKVIHLTQRLPQNWSNAVVARQIIAAATSVGANIAEGHGRFTPGAHRHHLSIAKGSAAETDSWLDLLRRMGVVSEAEEAQLHQECSEIMSLLKSKILYLERFEHPGNNDEDVRIREQTAPYVPNLPTEHLSPPWPFDDSDYLDG